MPKIVQLRRMTTAAASAYVGPVAECIVDLGSFGIRVQDGATPGGFQTIQAANNLADLTDKAIARSNLGLGSAALLDAATLAPIDNPNFTTNARVAGANILVNGGALGTPLSGTLTNCTLPIAGLSGLGAGVAALLALASTGTGGLVGKNAPSFTGGMSVAGGVSFTGGAVTMSNTLVTQGDITCANGDIHSGNSVTATGFNVINELTWNGNTLVSANPCNYNIVARTNGVALPDGGNAWNAISDIRDKTALKKITNASKKIKKLRAVTYKYKTDKKKTKRRVGLIAQDVKKVQPEAVNMIKGKLHLSLEQIVPLLIASNQEMQIRIEKLERKLRVSSRR